MTTLPVAPLAVPTTATVYFPHFAAGGGWTTQVILVNPTHAPISGSVQFFGPGSETEAAAPATLTLADGRSGSTFSYAIPPRSATRLRTSNPAGPLEVGSVRAVPDPGQPAPSGVSIFTFQKDGTTVSEAGVPASTAGTAFRLYVEASGTPGQPHSVRSGIALTNTSDAPTTVSLELTDLDGTATGLTESLTLPASGHVARFIDEFFPALPTPFSGILRITSTAPNIAAVGLRLAINPRNDILVTTTPPVDENAAPLHPACSSPILWIRRRLDHPVHSLQPLPGPDRGRDDPVQGAGRTAPGVVRGADGASAESVKTPVRGQGPTHRHAAHRALRHGEMGAHSERLSRHRRRGSGRAGGGMGATPAGRCRSRFVCRAEEPHRPSSVDKIPLALLCRGGSGPPETPPWGPMKNHCVNGFAGGSAVAGCSGSAVIVTGATNTAVSDAGRKRAGNKFGPPSVNTSEARRDGTITETGTGSTGHAAAATA